MTARQALVAYRDVADFHVDHVVREAARRGAWSATLHLESRAPSARARREPPAVQFFDRASQAPAGGVAWSWRECYGMTVIGAQVIRIRRRLSPDTTAHVAAHETAHAFGIRAEDEADALATAVCRALGSLGCEYGCEHRRAVVR